MREVGGRAKPEERRWDGPDKIPLTRRRFVAAGLGGALALSAAGLLGACGEDDESQGSAASTPTGREDVAFGFSHPFAEVPIVAVIKRLVAERAKGHGWEVQLDETQQGKLQDQVNTIENWVAQNLNAICAAPTDPSALEPLARRAQSANIMWTTYGVEMENAAGGVLFPPRTSGEITARATVDWILKNNPSAEVLILGDPTNVTAKLRSEIPQRMIREKTNAKVLAFHQAIEQSKGLQVTEDVLQGNPNLSVVVGGNDDGALGAAQAFERAGKDKSKTFIIGQDGSKDALVAIRNKRFLDATAALDIQNLCNQVVDLPRRLMAAGWKRGDEPEYLKIDPVLVTADDRDVVDRLLKPLA
jgi:ribose transport system substrate-binding protein